MELKEKISGIEAAEIEGMTQSRLCLFKIKSGLSLTTLALSLAFGHAQAADEDNRYILDKLTWEQAQELGGGASLLVGEAQEGNDRCYTLLQTTKPDIIKASAADPYAPCRLRVWMAKIPLGTTSLRPQVLADPHGARLKLSEFASREGALIAINGGYFQGGNGSSVSPVGKNGQLLFKGLHSVQRRVGNDLSSYFLARSAFYIREGKAGFGWVISGTERLIHLAMPLDNHIGAPDTQVPNIATEFQFDQLIGGGPMLVRNGYKFVSWGREVFFDSGVSLVERDPRSAIGIREENGQQTLYLVVVEGRRGDHARGLSLQELADLMIRQNIQQAMNLDGGGSSALYFNGRIVNNTSDGHERKIKSAIGIFAQ